MNLAFGMTPPDGEVIRSQVVFDSGSLRRQTVNQNPLIAGPVDATTNRVLTKDILWSPRPRHGLGRNERAAINSEVPAFSVLNGIGRGGESKFHFFKEHWFSGLATNNMESEAMKSDTSIHVAVDVQGLTWMAQNNPDVTFRPGDEVMIDIPSDTADAQRRRAALGKPEGGIPTRRYTAFPDIWSPRKAKMGLTTDWAAYLRRIDRQQQQQPPIFPSTPSMALIWRQMAIMGALLSHGYLDANDQPASSVDFIKMVRGAADGTDAAGAEIAGLVDRIARGELDHVIAAIVFPTAGEKVVTGLNVPHDATLPTRAINGVQELAAGNLITVIEASVDEAGRNRVIGRAISHALPNTPLSILLYG